AACVGTPGRGPARALLTTLPSPVTVSAAMTGSRPGRTRMGPEATEGLPRAIVAPLISVVVPVYNEADNIQPFLRDLEAQVREPQGVLLVHDSPEDTTLPAIAAMQPPSPNLHPIHNTLGRGVLNAIKAGFQASRGDVIVVMMADRSDEPKDVAALA